MTATFITQDKYELYHGRLEEMLKEVKNELGETINEKEFNRITEKINTEIQDLKNELGETINEKEFNRITEKINTEIQDLKNEKIKADTIASETAKNIEGKASKKNINIYIAISILSGLITIAGIIAELALFHSAH
jgi:hypothetical protein